jgi:hypothetical protein
VVPVPPGKYVVHVSHGFEWTTAVCAIEVPKEGSALLEATLERVVDTRGYISADLHLHTLTFSGHGDANVDERMITLCAENVEWAVATDHNHVTDYVPYVERLGAQKWIACTPGNEVTTTWIGHFNAFPFDPARTGDRLENHGSARAVPGDALRRRSGDPGEPPALDGGREGPISASSTSPPSRETARARR